MTCRVDIINQEVWRGTPLILCIKVSWLVTNRTRPVTTLVYKVFVAQEELHHVSENNPEYIIKVITEFGDYKFKAESRAANFRLRKTWPSKKTLLSCIMGNEGSSVFWARTMLETKGISRPLCCLFVQVWLSFLSLVRRPPNLSAILDHWNTPFKKSLWYLPYEIALTVWAIYIQHVHDDVMLKSCK